MSATIEEDRVRTLEQFANATAAATAAPASLPALATERVIVGAQAVAVKRDEKEILNKLRIIAAAAGEDFFYRIPVRNREGGTDYLEGASIKCATTVARLFGNCSVDVRVMDTGSHWLFYAKFQDFETGFEITRPLQQRKSQKSIKGDSSRQEDIAFLIGTSKATRNVVVNALEFFTSFAAEEAKHSIVDKVGKRLDYYKQRVVERLEELKIDIKRVEVIRGRAIKDWLATDVAKTIAELKAIGDGMAIADETYPPLDDDKKEHVDQKTGEVLDKFANSEGASSEKTATADDTDPVANADAEDGGGNDSQDSQQQSSPRSAVADDAEVVDGSSPSPSAATTASASTSSDPIDDTEYAAYADAWIDASTNAEEVAARWSREKKMRKDCIITQESFDRLEAKKKAKIATLKGK